MPGNHTNACSQRLADGLFGRKALGQMAGRAVRLLKMAKLGGAQNTLSKALSPFIQRTFYAGNFHHISADTTDHGAELLTRPAAIP